MTTPITTPITQCRTKTFAINNGKLTVSIVECFDQSPLEIALLLNASQYATRSVRTSDNVGTYIGEWKISDNTFVWSEGFITRNLRKGRLVIIDGLNKLIDINQYLREEIPSDLVGRLVLMVPAGTIAR